MADNSEIPVGNNHDDMGEENVGRNTDASEFVLTFEDITVHVPRVAECLPCCTFRNIKHLGAEYFGTTITDREAFYTLDRVSGCVRSGETCLILGKSGSGKSTLLRTLCGRLNETDELYGTVALNGIPIGQSNQSWRRMCSYVSADDGTHSPVLTVGETFLFAAQCTSNGTTPKEEIDGRVDWMLNALGLYHVKNTYVGDENLRGVSGGQKRRVTVGEMLLNPNARIFCLDNITDGLASTDSYSLLQQISAACKKNRIAAIITLLQPSDEIVQLFDKLLVLSSDGQQSYFGPVDRSKLREIFIEDADQLVDSGSIADLVAHGELNRSSVRELKQLTNRFLKSKLHIELLSEISVIRANGPAIQDREIALNEFRPRTKYSSSGWYQLKIIASRRLKLIKRNSMTYARVFIALFFGLIVGSLFSSLNRDIIGALGKTGYIFLSSFLVLMLSAAVTIPDGFRQRIVLFKHRNAEFYSGRIAYIVQIALDLPLSIIEATLISIISYWWVDMTPGANHFFLFLFALVGLECVGQAFARVLCAISRTQVSANVASSLGILLFATVGGFMPAYDSVTSILRWLSWLTPVAYAFEAMMINQFDGTTFSALVIVEPNSTVSVGTVEGMTYLKAQSLPRSQWTSNQRIKVFDCLMLYVFALVLDAIGMHFQERTRQWYFNQIRRPRARVCSSFQNDNESSERLLEDHDLEAQDSKEDYTVHSLTVLNLCYTVKTVGKKNIFHRERAEVEEVRELLLLNNVSARFTKGRMCALMGQSGAGKTTLLDVIAGYKTGGKITGDIMINGHPKLDVIWKVISGYAEQQDIFNPYMSVLETIEFTAACHLPKSVDRNRVIKKVIELMGLESYTNMIVGREKEGEGLPKHARKRLTIANQLVVQPKVLFLDEPTSGLGENAAALVIAAIRRSTDALGLITLVTIHQPSRKMFESFDDLLLLAKGGRVSYCGEIGHKSNTLLSHFALLSGEEPHANINPPDFVLKVLDNGSPDEAVAAFQQCDLAKNISAAIDTDIASASGNQHLLLSGSSPTFFPELFLLFKRQFLVQWRNPSYCFMRLSVSAGSSFILGLLFYDIEHNVQGAVFTIASLFFMIFILVIPMQSAVIPLIEDRSVLYREAMSGTYSRLAYGLGQLLADIPFHAINTFIMYVIIYQMIGFRAGPEYVGLFIFMLFLANWSIMSMGQLFALVTPNEETANGLAGLSVILSVCLMGFLITSSAMPAGWQWAYNGNLFRYILQGLVTNELSGQAYHIDVGKLIPELNSTDVSLRGVFDGGYSIFQEKTFVPDAFFMMNDYGINVNDKSLGVFRSAADENVDTYKWQADQNSLMWCLIRNNCFIEPALMNFKKCTVSSTAVCTQEFEAVLDYFEDGDSDVAHCFGEDSFQSNLDTISLLDVNEHEGIVSCVTSIFFPFERGVNHIIQGFKDLWKIYLFIKDIIENGIDIPGDAILFYFGWSEFDIDTFSFIAPWKWHYCVTNVVLFLVSMEILKLFAIRFIVWTKR